jgi:hypothetical protein
MENESFGQKVKRTTTKFVKRVLILGLLLLAGLLAFWQWGVYEEGVKAGKVLSVSEKGFIFKTHEGKLNLETFGALKGASPIAESFDFSVEKGNDEVIKDLQEVALSGERVNLYFIKRYVRFPWRGDTNVFVEKVERLK